MVCAESHTSGTADCSSYTAVAQRRVTVRSHQEPEVFDFQLDKNYKRGKNEKDDERQQLGDERYKKVETVRLCKLAIIRFGSEQQVIVAS